MTDDEKAGCGCVAILGIVVVVVLSWIGWDNVWGWLGGVWAWVWENGGWILLVLGILVFWGAASDKEEGPAGCGCFMALLGLGILLIKWWWNPGQPPDTAPSTEPGPGPVPSPDEVAWYWVWWETAGGWATVLFVFGWFVGTVSWLANQEERGPFKPFVKDARGCVGLVVMLAVWGASVLAAELGRHADTAVTLLSGRWTGPLEWTPYFVLLTLFLAMRLVLVPFQLSHARVHHKKAEVGPWMHSGEVSQRALLAAVVAFALNGLFLFWIAEAARTDAAGWASNPDTTALYVPAEGIWVRFGLLLLFFAVEVGLTALFLWGSQALFAGLTGAARGQHPFLARRDWKDGFRYAFGQEMLLDLPLLWILLLYQRENEGLLTVVACFLAVKVLTLGLTELLSWGLDWNNDRWLANLERQAKEGDAARRSEAAEKLRRIRSQL